MIQLLSAGVFSRQQQSVLVTLRALNPVALWPLNELTGTVMNDATGNGHDGTYEGGFSLGQGVILPNGEGNSVGFDVTARGLVPDDAALCLTTAGTCLVWSADAQPFVSNIVIGKGNCGSTGYIFLTENGTDVSLGTWNGSGLHALHSFGTFTGKKFAAGRWDGINASVWADDAEVGAAVGTWEGADDSTGSDLEVGKSSSCVAVSTMRLSFAAVFAYSLSNDDLMSIWRAGQ